MTKHTFELKLVMQALDNLSERQRHIFIERTFTYKPTTYKKLGEHWGVSMERIRQLFYNADRKIAWHCQINFDNARMGWDTIAWSPHRPDKGKDIIQKRLQHFKYRASPLSMQSTLNLTLGRLTSSRPISLNHMAELSGVSASSLYDMFHQENRT